MTGQTAFPLPFHGAHSAAEPRALRELQMMRCSALIREKSDWFVKMTDPDIVSKWTQEAVDQGMTKAQVRYVLAELAHYATLRDPQTGIEVADVDGVWRSDTLIEDDLRSRLCEAVRALEDVPDEEKDWHPGSDEQVLDLVHPSLFCLVKDVSGAPERAWQSPTTARWSKYEFSEKFQWLPTDVDVDSDGGVSFRSYVNNVHPEKHRDLVEVLPDVMSRMIPLWEKVITDLRNPRPLRIVPDPFGWYPDEPDIGEDVDAWSEWREDRHPVLPDAPEFDASTLPEHAHQVSLRGRRLQVIVKLANIHLTPDKPEYPGGSWHVEGMLNERIVSTGIYYWDSENTTESRLGFRTAVEDPTYEQNDDEGMREVYGLENEEALNQELGSVATPAGRCLAFPNVLQHRVASFRLADPAKPGHRKILVFFLVDPSKRIMSTSDIPPQQPWSKASTMTLEEAKIYREQLMQERKFFTTEHNEELYEREFSLCEH
ncbi:uncharacterized protein DUF4246 [Stackebrandtia endophytica]|uniref:Uncharacterized protein DUF4246 n=2 Tax=Stackebrandtia endophytica TaxID=1496996 RepID=A0A543AY75_9ACTN|nr:DUF4246 domain-containing protein [Stackebrandtia endophytica]TQL77532.1 uncharacterized protein DUF4246 [Stackebrandtia endophytica]